MKKFSFLIVCLCAGMAFVSQAQDTGDVKRTAGGDGPDAASFQRRPRDWDEPIPGPLPSVCPGGWHFGKDGNESSPLDGLEKGTVRPGTVLPNIKPGGDQTNGGLRPGVDHGPIVWAPSHESGGSSIVPDMADRLPNVNGDGTGASSFQRRPRDWDEPIPGPLPAVCPGGWHFGKDGNESSPLDGLEKGTVRPGTVLPNIKPGGDQTNGGLRPGVDHGPIVWAPSHKSGGSPMVADMIDGLLNGSTDVPDMNGDGKADISDVTTAINRLLRAQ